MLLLAFEICLNSTNLSSSKVSFLHTSFSNRLLRFLFLSINLAGNDIKGDRSANRSLLVKMAHFKT